MRCGCEYFEAANRRQTTVHKLLSTLFCLACAVLPCRTLAAQGLLMQSGPLVDHPVSHLAASRSAGNWRSGVGTWGENLADQTLRLRGFNEIHEIKHGSNNGIDRIAVKRGADGRITAAKLVEVKTTRSSRPKLGQTRYGGRQMSRRWLAANLRIMRNSGDPALKSLAVDLSRYRTAANVPIMSMGEVMHVNTRTGKLTGYAADGRIMRYDQSLERLLKNIKTNAGSKTARNWATRAIGDLGQIKASRMADYLGQTAAQQSKRSLVSSSTRNISSAGVARSAISRQSRSAVATTIFKRSAGRVAIFTALAMDAREIYDAEYAYRSGTISARQRNIQLFSTVGGMGGAFAGASAGAVAGAWIGGFGGPFAWITMPAGGLIGGMIGGVAGYFGGSAVAGYGATAWYDSIDASVRDKFEVNWLNGQGMTK